MILADAHAGGIGVETTLLDKGAARREAATLRQVHQ
jgi:hypothetical protein